MASARDHGIVGEFAIFSVRMVKAGHHRIVFFRDLDRFLIELVGKGNASPVS